MRDKRLEGLKDLLLDRNYPEKLINSAIERVKKIPRKVALKEMKQLKSLKRPVFAVQYDPQLPSISQIQANLKFKNTYAANQLITKIKSYYTFYVQDVLMPNLTSKNYLKTTKIADLVV